MALPKVSQRLGVPKVEVGEHQEIPAEFTLTWKDPQGVEPSLRMEFSVIAGTVQCRELHIVAPEGGRELRSKDMRALSLPDYLEYAVSRVAWHVETDDAGRRMAVMRDVPEDALDAVRGVRAAKSRRKMTPDLLREVATVYRAHLASNPTQAVAEHFGLASDRTARMWVKRAREAGELGESIKGKAGERE